MTTDNTSPQRDFSRPIQHKLRDLERATGITILYACEAGSRAWGFASRDSDYDIRFIYKRPAASYLTLHRKAKYKPIEDILQTLDTIESKVIYRSYISGYEDLELDMAGWDVDKALKLTLKANASIYEWLNASTVYMSQPAFVDALQDEALSCFVSKSMAYHYYGLAQRHAQEYLFKGQETVPLKKYLYIVRCLLAVDYICYHQAIPPLSIHDLILRSSWSGEDCRKIEKLLEYKSAGIESMHLVNDSTYILTDMPERLKYTKRGIQADPSSECDSKYDSERLNKLFRDTVLSY